MDSELPGLDSYPVVTDDHSSPVASGSKNFLRKGSKKRRTYLKRRLSGAENEFDYVTRTLTEARRNLQRLADSEGLDFLKPEMLQSSWSPSKEVPIFADQKLLSHSSWSPPEEESVFANQKLLSPRCTDLLDTLERESPENISPLTVGHVPAAGANVGRMSTDIPKSSLVNKTSLSEKIWGQIHHNLYDTEDSAKLCLREKMLEAREARLVELEQKVASQYEQLREIRSSEQVRRAEEKRRLLSERDSFRSRLDKANDLIQENRHLLDHVDSLRCELAAATGHCDRLRSQLEAVRSRCERLEEENTGLTRDLQKHETERASASRSRVRSTPPLLRLPAAPPSNPPVLMTELRAQKRVQRKTQIGQLSSTLESIAGSGTPPSAPPPCSTSLSSFSDRRSANLDVEEELQAFDRENELRWVESVIARRDNPSAQVVVSQHTLDAGKEETRFEDGHFEISFPSGMRKVIWPDSTVAVLFKNRDVKVSSVSESRTAYAFANGVLQVTAADGGIFNSFPDGQVELRKSTTLGILFPNGSIEFQDL